MTSNVHQLPCGRSEHEDYGCIDCGDYPCMLWKAARGEMRIPGEIGRTRTWGRKIKYMYREGRSEYWLRVDKECYEAQSIIALRKEEDK